MIANPFSDAELAGHLGKRLRYLRGQLGITQEELEVRACIERTHLSRRERGKALPNLARLAHLAATLGMEISEPFRGVSAAVPARRLEADVSSDTRPLL